eukprot:6361140-Prymnesium_polylepis.2
MESKLAKGKQAGASNPELGFARDEVRDGARPHTGRARAHTQGDSVCAHGATARARTHRATARAHTERGRAHTHTSV